MLSLSKHRGRGGCGTFQKRTAVDILIGHDLLLFRFLGDSVSRRYQSFTRLSPQVVSTWSYQTELILDRRVTEQTLCCQYKNIIDN
jgi:hypothetical protein